MSIGHPTDTVSTVAGAPPFAPGLEPQTQTRDRTLSNPTIASYVRAFSAEPSWRSIPSWPPDVFAMTNLVLDHTEAYRFVVAPEAGQRWPPRASWNVLVDSAAEAWRLTARSPGRPIPDLVRQQWEIVFGGRHIPLRDLREGGEPELRAAILTLHAMADQACRNIRDPRPSESNETFEHRAWKLLAHNGSLSRFSAARIRIVPKGHLPGRGLTIRSLSRYLALYYESVNLKCTRLVPGTGPEEPSSRQRDYNFLLVPWPLRVEGSAFRPVEGPLENMDPSQFGFFEFAPQSQLDRQGLKGLLEAVGEPISAVVLPEGAAEPFDIEFLERLLSDHNVGLLIAGIRESATGKSLGQNYVHIGVKGENGWEHYEQAKHNRWCLDANQLRQYHLTKALQPSRLWWEAIELPERSVQVIDVGYGATTAPLICEDLARLDEVSDLLRRIGPTIVVTVLLDGPQLAQRWPSRYAMLLADDPGSTVLTLTSFGMVRRSTPPGKSQSRAVAMWNDATTGLHEIHLARGARGILLSATLQSKTSWTADGRRHDDVPNLVLSHLRQIRT